MASQSPLKAEAVYRAFAFVFPHDLLHMTCLPGVKGIPEEQPIGAAQTLRGAEERMANSAGVKPTECYKCKVPRRYDDDAPWERKNECRATMGGEDEERVEFTVAIEDGLIERDGGYWNRAAYILRVEHAYHPVVYQGWSEDVKCEWPHLVREVLAEQQRVTYGKLLCQQRRGMLQDGGIGHEDWFWDSHPSSRVQVLKEAVIEGLYRLVTL
jgi:non-canonical (house-cleaning) NTP pyrophosphatase